MTLDIATFPASAKKSLRVIDNPDGSLSLEQALRASGCAAGVNGGYFDPAFLPIGLRVIDATVVRPLIKARLMTGVLFSARGSFQIVRVESTAGSAMSPRRCNAGRCWSTGAGQSRAWTIRGWRGEPSLWSGRIAAHSDFARRRPSPDWLPS